MKRYLLLLVVALAIGTSAKAQYITIPDANFAALLANRFPLCMSGNQLDTTSTAITTLRSFTISNSNLQDITGIQYFDSLQFLNCSSNQLTFLPELPATLTELTCSNNKLTSLSVLPASLLYLSCSNNKLTALPSLPTGLYYLDCNYNLLTALPAYPPGLTTLFFGGNQFAAVPPLPATLKQLDCSRMPISALPSTLPPLLQWFDCSAMQIRVLPPLANTIKFLMCAANKLTSLPTLPDSLILLSCSNNQLTSLPALPARLLQLNCGTNGISSLPAFPPELTLLSVEKNPDLRCLPPLKKFIGSDGSFIITGTGITCLPNKIEHTYYNAIIESTPLCDEFNNTNNCEIAMNIQGFIYNDQSPDCQMQGSEPYITLPVKINLYRFDTLVQSTYSTNGKYGFYTDFATYRVEIDTLGIPLIASCKADTTITVTAEDPFHYQINFGTKCKPGFDLAAQAIAINTLRARVVSNVSITAGDISNLYGGSCAAGTSGTVRVTITGPTTYLAPQPGSTTPSSVNNNVITWDVPDFGNISGSAPFNFTLLSDDSANIGNQVCITLTVTPTVGDGNPANNTLTQCFEVVASYDPNIKQVYPDGNIDTATNWLTYTIHFQNTGTAEAIHIYLLDTLSNNFDVSSFQLLSSSHKNTTQISGNGIVKFNFPNIMLPDSNANEPLSHGYVQYKVKLKDNLPIGTQIQNTAYIYFDFNAPVVTNTTLNTITTDVATAASPLSFGEGMGVRIFPNPADQFLYINTTGTTPQWLTIYNVNGQKIIEQAYKQQIDISTLTNGIYFIEVKSDKATARAKFVKM